MLRTLEFQRAFSVIIGSLRKFRPNVQSCHAVLDLGETHVHWLKHEWPLEGEYNATTKEAQIPYLLTPYWHVIDSVIIPQYLVHASSVPFVQKLVQVKKLGPPAWNWIHLQPSLGIIGYEWPFWPVVVHHECQSKFEMSGARMYWFGPTR